MSKNTNTINTPANTMKTGRWSPAENEALLKAVSHKPAKTTMTEVFNQFGSSHNRAAGSVAQHYYQLSKESSVVNKPEPKMSKNSTKAPAKQNKANPNDISSMVNKIKKMPTQAIRSLSYIVNSMQVQ